MSVPWIDISVPLYDGMVHWPGDAPFQRIETMAIAKGDECNLSKISTTAHAGTHMDAPKHFLQAGASIDTLPLSAVMGRARVIEIHDQEQIRVDELRLSAPTAGERILFKTLNSARAWQTPVFQEDFVHISPSAAEYLAECGVQTVGIDYLSVGGFRTGGAGTHRALLEAGVWIIEGLDLSAVARGNYELICLPLKILGSDGAPARAIIRVLAHDFQD